MDNELHDAEGEFKALNTRLEESVPRRDAVETTLGTKTEEELDRQRGELGGTIETKHETGLVEFANELKALAEGSGGGAFIAPPDFRTSMWDRLAARSVGLRSGFTVIPTTRDEVHVPKNTSDVTAAFVAEAGTINASDPGLDEEIVNPRKLASRTIVSNELVADSNPAVLRIVRENMARANGLALDLAFYEGDGTGAKLTGLANVSGIQTLAHDAALTDLDPFADAVGTLEEADAEATAFVMHPRDWRALLKLKEDNGGSNLKPLLQQSAGSPTAGIRRSIYGVPVFLSSQLVTDAGAGTNESTIYAYQAGEVVAVRREELRIELDPFSRFDTDESQLRCISRWGLAVPNPEASSR